MLELHALTIRAGAFQLAGISLQLQRGGCGVLMGPTGSGKTTLLEAICGLRTVEGGEIRFEGRDLTRLHPGNRGIGLVPQDNALFTALTVRRQLAFGPERHGWERARVEETVHCLARQLDLVPLLDRKPHGLSGGEAKRVALGRALAIEPEILCLDEPLTGLDETTHGEILTLLRETIRRLGITTLLVTHSRSDAEALGDVLFQLRHGACSGPHTFSASSGPASRSRSVAG